jgi:type I restriction enzyme S subunit
MTSGKFWANNHTHVIQGKFPISTEFLYLCLSNVDISGYVTGAAQPKITQGNLNRIPVVVAKRVLLDSFNLHARAFFAEIKLLERKNQNLRQTRDLLLPKLISGEVDVSELDIEIKGAA